MTATEVAREVYRRLSLEFPGSERELCALRYQSAFQLLVATVLSAQTTDAVVNSVTTELFRRYPDCHSLAEAAQPEVETIVHATGFFRSKAANVIGLARALRDRYGCQVPASREELCKLPGVGRKTANVVLSVYFGEPGLPVDTHVARVSSRLGLTTSASPEGMEAELGALLLPEQWGLFSLRLILHGRRVCGARRPECGRCVLADLCPSADVSGAAVQAS